MAGKLKLKMDKAIMSSLGKKAVGSLVKRLDFSESFEYKIKA